MAHDAVTQGKAMTDHHDHGDTKPVTDKDLIQNLTLQRDRLLVERDHYYTALTQIAGANPSRTSTTVVVARRALDEMQGQRGEMGS